MDQSTHQPLKAITCSKIIEEVRTRPSVAPAGPRERQINLHLSIQSKYIKGKLDFPGGEKFNQGCVNLFRGVLNRTDTPIVGV